MPVLFDNREEAGQRLAESYQGPREDLVVLGIPRGGLPVGYPLAASTKGKLDVIVVRKLPIPYNPEMGFGAIAPDGSIVINERVMHDLQLPEAQIQGIAAEVLEEVARREKAYRGDRPFPELKGKNVVLCDDGLATGYTMIAAIKMARQQDPRSVNVAVPVSPADTADKIKSLADYLHCLYISTHYPFAVASFYRDFHDMNDREVISYLNGE
jgi:putative phosphoribosyl transferase